MGDFMLSAGEVHRRLTIDDREYHLVVFDAGDDFVGLRVVGWEGGGRLADIGGELPLADVPEVTGLLAAVLAGCRAQPPDPPPSGPPSAPPSAPSAGTSEHDWWAVHRAAAPNAGRPWAPQDLDLLVARFNAGASVKAMTEELGRTEGGVRSRLQLLGLSRSEPSAGSESPGGSEPPGGSEEAPGGPEGRPGGLGEPPGGAGPPGGDPAVPATPEVEGPMPMAG
ncbi:hypothetical protein ACFFX1_25480 [Dactylosporangium sucinum]|nr:hypothetical protein [Dactylosporangium sucinum]